jgi:hypothetical protein
MFLSQSCERAIGTAQHSTSSNSVPESTNRESGRKGKHEKKWTYKELKSYFPSTNDPFDRPAVKESIDRVFRRILPLDCIFFSDRKRYDQAIDTIAINSKDYPYDAAYVNEAIQIAIETHWSYVTVKTRSFPYAYFDKVLNGTMSLNKPTSHKDILNQWCAKMGTAISGERSKLRIGEKERQKFNELWVKYFPKVEAALNVASKLLGKREEEVPCRLFTESSPPIVAEVCEVDQDLLDFANAFNDDTGLQSIFDEAIVSEARLVTPDQGFVSISDGQEDICSGTVFPPVPTEEAIAAEQRLLQTYADDPALTEAVPDPISFCSKKKKDYCSVDIDDTDYHVIDIVPCTDSIYVEIEKDFCPENLILVKYPSSWFFNLCAAIASGLLLSAPFMFEYFGLYGLIPMGLSLFLILLGIIFMICSTLYLSKHDRTHMELLRARRIKPSYMLDSSFLTCEFSQGEDLTVDIGWDARPVSLKNGTIREEDRSYILRDAFVKIYSNTKPDSWIVRFFLRHGLARRFWNLTTVHKYRMRFLPQLLQDVLDIKALQALSMTEYVARVRQIMASAVHFNFDKTRILDYENLAMNTYIVASIIKKNDENKRLGNFHRGLWTQVPGSSTV